MILLEKQEAILFSQDVPSSVVFFPPLDRQKLPCGAIRTEKLLNSDETRLMLIASLRSISRSIVKVFDV